jgi:chaperone modulatory protein CbpM
MERHKETLTGLVLDEMSSLSLEELCHACRVRSEWIEELVDEGILEPQGGEVRVWHFPGVSLRRVRTVHRLQQDLGVNLAGAALVLDLMDELEAIRARLRRFESS